MKEGIKKALVMHHNEGYLVGIVAIYPSGTNSTMFTACCHVAICDDQGSCPSCNRPVIGHEDSPNDRRRIRWSNATSGWKR